MSVVIPAYLVHWNAPEWCARSVQALTESEGVTVPVTVINNSPDVMPRLPPGAEMVDAGGNIGFAAAANRGLDLAVAGGFGHVLIGCHDVQVEPDAVVRMVAMLDADPGLGIVGPIINGWDEGGSELEYVSGTLMLIRAEVARSLRFDQRFGSYVEDVDYCVRARQGVPSWRIGRCAEARVSALGSVDSREAERMTEANGIAFVVRHHLWRQVPRRIGRLVRHRRWSDLALAVRQTRRLYRRLP